ncbi:3-phosphoshikimate 1-carboxyvinyltransferase [Pseudoalteromonas shioyasakiensis]|uniref:3-phosphoshikimate 1-carboxyvinyltransferase n=1 Tax=Pseudoalteromonas shioyasakiensis TaxID=1190813 RepID=A0ABT6TYU0_9GAMM|nr:MULTISPECIES: 3-phosphoshikimate 1-carboxyvinyltransferase [Pseudoalteromonas]MDI4667988.1 3-phosphoshikimate 1-carboxyvinyltransferase [Pseudoalteromonas shioyasakiensis]MDI4672782.1 3-phosphoshikimate 1-carboxyvinyltransferase [Pseudoalteromonas shioyasakiensis]MDI4684846.1 3-phosphoshikimate 1-carboxyvinyltransferase [Pseudoalteromonas shioyasakiensis]MDI4703190.1 3-phosphoshikimate 1-carboxyvinyltransferase [Pseudoalteromonas shioyasakiensis]NUJ20183.1 3-phosphoshikimate 1-carboxyvinylt
MEQLRLEPITKVNGSVTLPGSKSLSNRILLLAALAEGTTVVENLLDSDDIRHMLGALNLLGVNVSLNEDKTVATVEGVAGKFKTPSEPLFLGNAGTAYRPLTAVLAAVEGEYQLVGEPRMEERPIGHLVDALQALGGDVEYLKHKDYPPLAIKGGKINGGKVEIDGSISSQFLTALLMAAPLFNGDTEITIKGTLVSKPYIDITLDVMKRFGVTVSHDNYEIFYVKGCQQYQALERIMVEGDASSASYFVAAAAIAGGEIEINGVGAASVQGDIGFAKVMEQVGAKIDWYDEKLVVRKGELNAVDIDANAIPDAAMTLATVALFAKGKTAIRNIYNWRVKETDRLYAMATELRKVGAEVVEGEDFIEITPPDTFNDVAIDTYNDHRIAMCFAMVAVGGKPITINDPKCTYKTFPTFFKVLESVSSQ